MTERKKNKTPSPFSLRLTFEERASLEKEAAGMALGAYIRWRLLTPDTPPPKTRNKFPVKDHRILAELIAKLGQSHMAGNLNQLAKLANMGSLPVTPETEDALQQACVAISTMRNELLKGLGLSSGEK